MFISYKKFFWYCEIIHETSVGKKEKTNEKTKKQNKTKTKREMKKKTNEK